MFKKALGYSVICALLLVSNYAIADSGKKHETKTAHTDNTEIDGFLNIKAVHERANEYPFGSKNCSGSAFNPVFSVGNFTVDADFYYGRQYSYGGVFNSERNLFKITSYDKRSKFRENYKKTIKENLSSAMSPNTDKAHFYRNYTRGIYENHSNNFRVVVGDTTTRNHIGFQQALSGVGISIFRQSGNGEIINNSTPIVITRVSKIECKLGDEILSYRVFTPGVYTLEDLPEEAKIPGATIKINDQLNRTYTLKVDYFSGYGMLEAGKDDFDIAIVREHKWDVDDPHRIGYFKKPRYSANYRYGVSDETTVGVGIQGYENTQIFDVTAIFATDFGMFSPHASFSNGNSIKDSKKTVGAGILYVIPKNELGIFFETFLGIKGKGFGDLGKEKDVGDEYNKLIDKYFTTASLKEQFKNSVSETSTKQIIARIYTKPVFGITPSFTFNGSWTKDSRLREYTLSFTKKIWDCCFTISGGLSYDDPSKGANLQSPDRRLTIACCIPIGTDFKVQGSYFHHDEDRYRNYEKFQYTPSEIPGLEVNVEHYSRPDFRNPCTSVKYDGKYCNLKAEETIRNSYSETNKQHTNQQRFFFGTSLSPSRIRAYQKNNFNVLRTGRDEKK